MRRWIFYNCTGNFFDLFIILIQYLYIIIDVFYDVKKTTVYSTIFCYYFINFYVKTHAIFKVGAYLTFSLLRLGLFLYIVVLDSVVRSWAVRGSVKSFEVPSVHWSE